VCLPLPFAHIIPQTLFYLQSERAVVNYYHTNIFLMVIFMRKIIDFTKKETVLVAACVLAVISSFIVTPDSEYADYIDFRTLGILFCLMAVVAGMRRLGLFDLLSQKLLEQAKNIRQLILILLLLCFVTSMFITNDVALITFVPFAFTLLDMAGESLRKKWIMPIVVMQTIAANLGSMLTPLGNPQNLYLYGKSDMGLIDFILLMLPYSFISLLLILIWVMLITARRNENIRVEFDVHINIKDSRKLLMYVLLFVLSLLVVLRIIHYSVAFAIVFLCLLVFDRETLKSVDYSLLVTFVGFFIFIGNMGRIPAFRQFLENIINGRETLTAILASQVVSNVPAALLLSGFTNNIEALIVGTDLGGLGTLIASMASLISYKLFAKNNGGSMAGYILYFTIVNVMFLLVLFCLYLFICQNTSGVV
jgi:Na+/H+ antiporter NhaD/arsenite permease-like protein